MIKETVVKEPKLYFNGGYVRDKFLGVECKDIDFTFVLDNINQTVESGFLEMESWMLVNGFSIFLSTPDMFTIRGKFPIGHPNEGLVADFVLARKEIGYVEGTRRPILELGTIEDDLIRRDFTVNAMAIDEDGKLIDLFDGISDLGKQILRTPINPIITMLDDPLRVLRCLRFAITKDFTIANEITDAWEVNSEEILTKLELTVSSQRIREELHKMFKFDSQKTINILIHTDRNYLPGLMDIIFKTGLWLKPSFEK